MSPADSDTTSPATSSQTAISRGVSDDASAARTAAPAAAPHRITAVVFVTIARSPSAARCDRPSWTKRMPITTVALLSALTKDSSASAVSNRLNGFR